MKRRLEKLSNKPFALECMNLLKKNRVAIEDVYNGILVRGRVSGDLLFYGMGAGKLPTAGAVVTDILDIASRGDAQPFQSLWTRDASIYVPTLTAAEQETTLATLGYSI